MLLNYWPAHLWRNRAVQHLVTNYSPRLLTALVPGAQVKAASGLRGTDWHNTSNPYCTVSLGPAQRRTQAAEAQLAPQWGSTFAFSPRDIVAAKQQRQQLVVRFEVWHEEAFGMDCFLGQVRRQALQQYLS
jgi:hypothetical protein